MKLKFNKNYVLKGLLAFLVLAGGIFLAYLLFHGTNVKNGISFIFRICIPIIYGFVLAYILTPALNYIESHWIEKLCDRFKIDKVRHKSKIRGFSIFITALLFVSLIYVLFAMLISQIVPSIQEIVLNIDVYTSNLTKSVNKIFNDNSEFAAVFEDSISIYSGEFKTWLKDEILPQTSELIKTLSLSVIGLIKAFLNLIIGFIISIYLMFNKEILSGQAKKIAYALFKTDFANSVIKEFRFVNNTFIGFIIGKVIDSIIIGLLCFIGTTLIGTPYAALVSVIIGVTNVIPFFGPYLGAIPCAIFILIVDLAHPLNCLYFVIFIIILQQFDGNILGPKILGNSTGLSSFWVIFAITLFGGMFGIVGMIIGVPIFAVLYNFIKRYINYRLKKKELPTDTAMYKRVGYINENLEFQNLEDMVDTSDKKSINRVFHGKKGNSSKSKS